MHGPANKKRHEKRRFRSKGTRMCSIKMTDFCGQKHDGSLKFHTMWMAREVLRPCESENTERWLCKVIHRKAKLSGFGKICADCPGGGVMPHIRVQCREFIRMSPIYRCNSCCVLVYEDFLLVSWAMSRNASPPRGNWKTHHESVSILNGIL
jgi:hypothetical protein